MTTNTRYILGLILAGLAIGVIGLAMQEAERLGDAQSERAAK